MKKASHTPGPLRVGTRLSHGTKVIGPLGVGVAWCGVASVHGVNGSYSIGEHEAAANARLFAAAPQTAAERDRLRETNAELLAELSALIDICKANGVGDHRLPEAIAVMEKAKAGRVL